MILNETQSASVCQAYCVMLDLEDAAASIGVKVCVILDSDGLFITPNGADIPHPGLSCFLRNVKDRTAKEIDTFKNDWIATLKSGKEKLRQDRIDQLKAELAELETL